MAHQRHDHVDAERDDDDDESADHERQTVASGTAAAFSAESSALRGPNPHPADSTSSFVSPVAIDFRLLDCGLVDPIRNDPVFAKGVDAIARDAAQRLAAILGVG